MNKLPDIIKRGDKWYVVKGVNEYGPFDTKQEAIEAAAKFVEAK